MHGGSSLFVKAGRYVTDDDYRSFRDFAPELLKYAMELSLHPGCGLAAILSLTWKDVHTVGVRRDRWEMVTAGVSGAKRKIAITQQIESALRKCRVMEPNWPHQICDPLRGRWQAAVSQGIQFDLGVIHAALGGVANQPVFISRHSR